MTEGHEPGNLAGRVALITGSGHGIGAATAGLMASRGAAVVVNDIVEKRAESTADGIIASGGDAVPITADVSQPDEVERLITGARDTFGDVDILVNNAYAQCDKPFLEHTIDDWDRVFAVIVRGAFLCSRAVLPAMIERRKGNIVNVASIAAFHTLARHAAYGAAKGAIASLTRDLASEVAEFGVRVNAVAPGPTDTKGYPINPRHVGILVDRLGQPDDIAQAIAFLVSDEASFIVGQTVKVAGGCDLRVGHLDFVS